jgi:hypothetical protein
MIGTIRKHSAWLWWVVAGLTIVSFVIFMGNGGTRNGGARNGGYGILYGKTVTPEQVEAARRDFYLFYWRHYHEFPNRSSLTQADMDAEIYKRLLLMAKARSLGIHVDADQAATVADEFLAALGKKGQTVPMTMFTDKVLTPEGLTVADFQRFIADDVAIEQMVHSMGLPGALITPQEAAALYERDNQEYSTEAVFFSATNYMSQVTVTPAAVSRFYTNHMAAYRLPDRVQIRYVAFELTNFMAAAEKKLGSTNVTAQADAYYAQHGTDAVPDAKTPEEAKAKIREMILRQEAAKEAGEQARQFVNTLFAMEPVDPENLVRLAQTNGLAVHTPAPFSATEGPEDFAAPAELVETAFKLTPDSPYAKPILGTEAVYVIGLDKQLPSAIQPFDDIQTRVAEDYKEFEGAQKARATGTNFWVVATIQMSGGKSFAQVAFSNGQTPLALKPFSLSSEEIPEAEGHAEVAQLKQAAFTTALGHVCSLVSTADGGFVLYVKSILPVDEQDKASQMPRYLAQLRRSRENEAFNLWLQSEANRELRNTPVYDEMMREKSAPGSR